MQSPSVMAELRVSLERQLQDGAINVAFLPNSNQLVVCGDSVLLWDVEAGHFEYLPLEGYERDKIVAISPTGMWLASGNKDKIVKQWNLISGQKQHTLAEGSERTFLSMAFSPNGKWLASGGDMVKLWNVVSGQLQHILTKPADGTIGPVAFSYDSNWLATSSIGTKVKLWEVSSWHLQHTLVGHKSPVLSVAFSPNNKWLASGSEDSTIKLWNLTSGLLQHTLTGFFVGHKDTVMSVAFSPNNRWIASGSKDNTVKLWNVASGHLQHTLTGGDKYGVQSVAFSPNGKWLASASIDRVNLWTLTPPLSPETTSPNSKKIDQIDVFSDVFPWSIETIAMIVIIILLLFFFVGSLLLVSFLLWNSTSLSLQLPTLRHTNTIIISIVIGITTTVIANYLYGSPEYAIVIGIILAAVVAHYLMKKA